MDVEMIQLTAEDQMQEAVKNYQMNISKISAGRANPNILDHIKIDYFDTLTPLNQIAHISVPEPRQLLIKPYDSSLTKSIIGVINSSSLGIHASDEGDKARITFPELTSERRRELVKSLGQFTEQARVKIRNARQEANKQLKALDLPEDQDKREHEEIQKLTDKYILNIETETKKKESDLMTM